MPVTTTPPSSDKSVVCSLIFVLVFSLVLGYVTRDCPTYAGAVAISTIIALFVARWFFDKIFPSQL